MLSCKSHPVKSSNFSSTFCIHCLLPLTAEASLVQKPCTSNLHIVTVTTSLYSRTFNMVFLVIIQYAFFRTYTEGIDLTAWMTYCKQFPLVYIKSLGVNVYDCACLVACVCVCVRACVCEGMGQCPLSVRKILTVYWQDVDYPACGRLRSVWTSGGSHSSEEWWDNQTVRGRERRAYVRSRGRWQ